MRQASRLNPNPDVTVRRDRLTRLKRLLGENKEDLLKVLNEDFSVRSDAESELTEFAPALDEIETMLSKTRAWMKSKSVGSTLLTFPAQGELVQQPRGVVGIVVPFNYPVNLTFVPLADALAAGNRVMIKVSEYTPKTGRLIQTLVARYFTDEEVYVVMGDVTVAKEFTSLAFDLLLYTGNSRVARDVMKTAAERLTPLVFELGGKCPAVITPQARFTTAVSRILFAKLINAGQTCIAPDTVWVPSESLDSFIEEAKKQANRFYPQGCHLTGIIAEKHFDRLMDFITDAKEKGARIEPLFDEETETTGRQILPALIINPVGKALASREEIFGPFLVLRTYNDVAGLIERLKQLEDSPLALYWFDTDKDRIEAVLREVRAGGVTVNDTFLHFVNGKLPFGGVGESGFGAYHGKTGFDAMSHYVPVVKQCRFNAMSLMNPPFGWMARKILKWMTRV